MTSKRGAALFLVLAACTSAGEELEPRELTVLSYNIKHGLGNDGEVDIGRAAALIDRLRPDLVALQEIDNGVRRSGRIDQMAVLGELTGMEARFGVFMAYGGGHYGIGLLSRLPIVAWENHRLPDGAEPRSALAAEVALPGGERLVFCSVHLYRTREERLAQAEAVVEALRGVSDPLILAGDFNSRPGSAVMELIEQHWTNPDKGEDNLTFSATEPRSEIDFILFRPRDRFEVVTLDVLDEPVVSDHRPVLVVLRLLPQR